jgi:hypothetical protein
MNEIPLYFIVHRLFCRPPGGLLFFGSVFPGFRSKTRFIRGYIRPPAERAARPVSDLIRTNFPVVAQMADGSVGLYRDGTPKADHLKPRRHRDSYLGSQERVIFPSVLFQLF